MSESTWDDQVSFVEFTALKLKVTLYAETQLIDGDQLDPELDGDIYA
jgi:hypothetical protein